MTTPDHTTDHSTDHTTDHTTGARRSGHPDDVVSLLEALVAIDSSNPSLSADGAGEAEMAAFVRDWAAQAGLQVEWVADSAPGGPLARPSIVVRGGRTAGGRRLLLCGHLDTVGLGGIQDPLTLRLDGDRLHGRGAYDMKAGLAAALVACRDAASTGIDGEVVVACVADEEHASSGIRSVLDHLTATGGPVAGVFDAAVVTEPTELAIGTGHRGFVWSEVEITGVAAHGSRPALGVDAIFRAGPVLVALDALNNRLQQCPHPFLGPGNLHGSLISGGTEESTIPDRCSVIIERRTLPGDTVATVEADLETVLDECRRADPALRVGSRTLLYRAPLETPADAAIVEAVADATRVVTGKSAPVTPVSYWADSAFLDAAGISTVLYGPPGEGAHADIEWVSLSGTRACAAVLTQLAQTFCA